MPYQVSGAKVLEQIVAQMHAKITNEKNLHDESNDKNPIRLVIIPINSRINLD